MLLWLLITLPPRYRSAPLVQFPPDYLRVTSVIPCLTSFHLQCYGILAGEHSEHIVIRLYKIVCFSSFGVLDHVLRSCVSRQGEYL